MHKVLIWGTGSNYLKLINIIKSYEQLGSFKIAGVTSNDTYYSYIDGYKFYKKTELNAIDFDTIIITNSKYKEVLEEINTLGIKNKNVISGQILTYPGFSFTAYLKLWNRTPSIIARNCWGGILYHSLQLRFQSPTINMSWTEEDFYKLLLDLSKYMEKPLQFVRMEIEPNLKSLYPICKLGDLKIHMNHYTSFEEAKGNWERRVKRIDYDHLVLANFTEREDMAEKFCRLPYKNKICFTNFSMKGCIDLSDIYNELNRSGPTPFWSIVNRTAMGMFRVFDPFELLINREMK